MKLLLAIVLLLSALLTTARAQQDADSRYITIYGVIQQADTEMNNGQSSDALTAYKDAQAQLLKFQQIYPDWETDIVSYRLNDLAGKIAALQAQMPAQNNSTATNAAVSGSTTIATTNAPGNNLAVNVLQTQLQSLKDQNAQLQAKLQEALSAQPQMVDASELTKADNSIRALMKENDLLKASLAANAPNTTTANAGQNANISELRAQLAETTQKLADEHARADKLSQENATLQLAAANSGKQSTDASNSLRDENDRLKSQLDSLQAANLQTANNNATAASETATQLAAAKSQVAALESAVMLANLEKTALEDRLKRANSALAQTNANNPPASEATVTNSAQTARLQNQVAILEARVAADESKPAAAPPGPVVQSTPVAQPAPEAQPVVSEQPAPVIQPAPVATPVATPVAQPAPIAQPTPVAQPTPAAEPESAPAPEPAPKSVPKSAGQMSADTAKLVASAQQHYTNHEYDQAETDYRKILEHDQNNGLVLANLAAIELQENKLLDAERDIKAALVQSPNDAYNLGMLGKIKFSENDYDDALNALSQSAKLDPNNPETQNFIGLTYSHKNLRNQAEAAFRKAIQIDPGYAPAHNNIAVIYLTQNPPMPQLARWHYQKALDSGQPRNPEMEKLFAEKGAPFTPAQ